MKRIIFKSFFLKSLAVFLIFFLDRITKIYILEIAELENIVDIHINSYLDIYLIWNKGIAFGLLFSDKDIIYNLVSLIIFLVIVVILLMIYNSKGFKQNSLILVFGGSLGNFFDRIYYKAVPDFIDIHVGNYHWFIFNVADIFITFGIMCLILIEIKKKKND
jgi:signal peptidase II